MPSAVRRRLTAAVLAVACALVLSGCVVIQSEDAGQPGVIDDFQIHTVVCLSGNASCPNGNSGGSLGPAGGGDALVAYRVPTFVSLPATLTTTAGTPLTLHQSPSYTGELTNKAAPPAGEKWVGYESDPLPSGGSPFELLITVSLPQGGGAPFRYRTVTGWRNTPSSPGDPVACGPNVTQLDPPINFSDPPSNFVPHTICVDSPSASELPNDNVVATRNLTIANGPGGQQVAQGTSTGAIPFSIVFAGPATPRATFKVAATTTLSLIHI